MTTMRRFKENRVGATLRRFRADRRGTTAAIFGLTLVPLMGFIGSAIDYSQATAARTAMQAAVDGAALALTKEPTSATPAQLQAKGEAVFRSLFKPAATVDDASVMVTRDGRTIRVAASGGAKTSIMQVVGFDKVKIGVEAKAAWGTRRIELALVLDNTGSMGRANKMQELIKAADGLIRQIQDSPKAREAVQVSLVPFDTQVRLEPGLRNATWLRPLKAGESDHGIWAKKLPSDEAVARAQWEGYVTDRDRRREDPVTGQTKDVQMNVSDAAPDRLRPETLYPMVKNQEGSNNHLAKVVPLTRDFSQNGVLRTTINAMRPRGCTNITLGAMWGLETLSRSEPFDQAVAYDTRPDRDVEKVMILLTDGWNTQDAFRNVCNASEGDETLDERTESACNVIKNRGVAIFTVKVVEGSDNLLRGCASHFTKSSDPFYRNGEPLYYPVTSASQLTDVFQTILNQILSTRLTH